MKSLLLALIVTLFISTTTSAQYFMAPQLSHGQGYNSSYYNWDLGWNLEVEARRQAMVLRAYSGGYSPTYNYYQPARRNYYYGRSTYRTRAQRWNGRRYTRGNLGW